MVNDQKVSILTMYSVMLLKVFLLTVHTKVSTRFESNTSGHQIVDGILVMTV